MCIRDRLTTDFTFSHTVKRVDVNVTIMDDDIVEFDEVFLGNLIIVTMGPDAPMATLSPANAMVTILDEVDSMLTKLVANQSLSVPMQCKICLFFLLQELQLVLLRPLLQLMRMLVLEKCVQK